MWLHDHVQGDEERPHGRVAFGLRCREPSGDLGATYFKQKEEPAPRPGSEHTWDVGEQTCQGPWSMHEEEERGG